MTTPEDPNLEKYINEVKSRREYSKAYYSKKKAEPPTEEEREEKAYRKSQKAHGAEKDLQRQSQSKDQGIQGSQRY